MVNPGLSGFTLHEKGYAELAQKSENAVESWEGGRLLLGFVGFDRENGSMRKPGVHF
jgi:hypothetical protein